MHDRPETSPDDAVRWWVGNDGDHTSMLYCLNEWEAYADDLAKQLSLVGTCPECGERVWATRDKDELYTTWKCQSCGWGDVQS